MCELMVRHNNHSFSFAHFALFRELKAASGEWISDISREVQRSESHPSEYLSASEIIRKSIRRSWTISSKAYHHTIAENDFLLHSH